MFTNHPDWRYTLWSRPEIGGSWQLEAIHREARCYELQEAAKTDPTGQNREFLVLPPDERP